MTTFYLTPIYPATFYYTATQTGATIIRTINLQGGVPCTQNQNFYMWKFDSIMIDVTLKDQSGNAIDITGSSIEWAVKYKVSSVTPLIDKTVSSGITITEASTGSFQISLNSNDTDNAQFSSGDYYHQAKITDVNGNEETIMVGTMTIYPSAF